MGLSKSEYQTLMDYRRANVPMFNDQKLKLGVFAMNCSNGMIVSEAPTTYHLTWEHTRDIVVRADQMGFEVALPVGRWAGFGGKIGFSNASFETYTWAAGLAEATKNIMVCATSHVSTVHPVMAAKQAVTIDHISNGRFGLNTVMGWFRAEMEMFGGRLLDHDERYRYGAEWIAIVKRLWTDPHPFDFDGQYFHLKGVQGFPKPVQRPHPVVINSGNSAAALELSAREVDVCFVAVDRTESITRNLAVKELGRKHGREISLFGSTLIVCRETEREAREVYQTILDLGDWQAARNIMESLGIETKHFKDRLPSHFDRFVAGWGINPLIGTPAQVTEQLSNYSALGLDGLVLFFLDYNEELKYFDREVMPLLKQAGLRH
jgi:FMNH2-dependent dimethyl sulfone monooxygenase